jgi:hypothetical protein
MGRPAWARGAGLSKKLRRRHGFGHQHICADQVILQFKPLVIAALPWVAADSCRRRRSARDNQDRHDQLDGCDTDQAQPGSWHHPGMPPTGSPIVDLDQGQGQCLMIGMFGYQCIPAAELSVAVLAPLYLNGLFRRPCNRARVKFNTIIHPNVKIRFSGI